MGLGLGLGLGLGFGLELGLGLGLELGFGLGLGFGLAPASRSKAMPAEAPSARKGAMRSHRASSALCPGLGAAAGNRPSICSANVRSSPSGVPAPSSSPLRCGCAAWWARVRLGLGLGFGFGFGFGLGFGFG